MKTVRGTTRDPGPLAQAMRDQAKFTSSGALIAGTETFGRGYLPSEFEQSFYEALAAETPGYFVYSYATPIAWSADGGKTWTVPKVKYSATTSKHQGTTRQAIGRLDGAIQTS